MPFTSFRNMFHSGKSLIFFVSTFRNSFSTPFTWLQQVSRSSFDSEAIWASVPLSSCADPSTFLFSLFACLFLRSWKS